MIQFEVNGEYLDLPADFSLQFKKKNILFSFDNIECERSTSFSIPATPHNNAIFTLAKWVQSEGVGMRRKYQAQMQDGLVVQDGYLHIDQYSAGKYNAVFVTGDLLGLKKLRDAGKIAEYYKPVGGIVWSTANIKDANTSDGQASLAITRYLSNVTLLHPSFNLGQLMQEAYHQLTNKNLPAYQIKYRLIPKVVEPMPKTDCTLVYVGTNNPLESQISDATFANSIAITDALSAVGTYTQILQVRVGTNQYTKLREFQAKQSLILTFPNDFPADYFLMAIYDTGHSDDPETVPYSQTWFLGDYYFYQATGGGTTVVGTPLAGRSVSVPSNTPFIIMDRNWFDYEPAPLNIDGFRTLMDGNYQISVEIAGDELQEGDTVRAVDLLPDLTLVELLKMYCALEGKMLYYDENGDIQFDDLDVSTWGTFDLTGKVIDESAMTRKFGDYAQQNIIDFKSGSDVMPSHRVSTAYTIDNDNIDEEKTLLTIPYSEGEMAERDGAIVARFDAEDTEKNTLYEQGVMVARWGGASIYGLRCELPKNAGLQALCDASTSQSIRARISFLEYEGIKPKTILFFDGVRYVWTESNWSKGVATFKVSKISA